MVICVECMNRMKAAVPSRGANKTRVAEAYVKHTARNCVHIQKEKVSETLRKDV